MHSANINWSAAASDLARAIGIRLREAILADLSRVKCEAEEFGRINIQEGTKGVRSGASTPRWIMVNDYIRDTLAFAQHFSTDGSRNLLAPRESYLDFIQGTVRAALAILHTHELKGFHDLRAAYASERYEQTTQHPPPISVARCYQRNRHLAQEAREQISYELGHRRMACHRLTLGGEHEHAIRYGAVVG